MAPAPKTNLTSTAATAARDAFLAVLESWARTSETNLLSGMTSGFAQIPGRLGGAFALEFALVCLTSLLKNQESLRNISVNLSKLVREPLLTGISLIELSEHLKENTGDARRHRESRLRSALESLHKAAAICEPEERPFVDLLRGLCAVQLSGGAEEAALHLTSFARACRAAANRAESEGQRLNQLAAKSETAAAEITLTNTPGLRGGLLIEMAIDESRVQRAHFLTDARRRRFDAAQQCRLQDQMLDAAQRIEQLVQSLTAPGTFCQLHSYFHPLLHVNFHPPLPARV